MNLNVSDNLALRPDSVGYLWLAKLQLIDRLATVRQIFLKNYIFYLLINFAMFIK